MGTRKASNCSGAGGSAAVQGDAYMDQNVRVQNQNALAGGVVLFHKMQLQGSPADHAVGNGGGVGKAQITQDHFPVEFDIVIADAKWRSPASDSMSSGAAKSPSAGWDSSGESTASWWNRSMAARGPAPAAPMCGWKPRTGPKWSGSLSAAPYVHHVGCVHGAYADVIEAALKYLGSGEIRRDPV